MSTKSRKTRELSTTDYQSGSTIPVPWLEWNDAELNAEKWDSSKSVDGHFLDPEPRSMPVSLEPHDWIRGPLLNNPSSDSAVLFSLEDGYPDFLKNNRHILHSEFVRSFISTMRNLEFLGRKGLRIEGESSGFVWLGASRPWKGWLNIYSMNKAGKSAGSHRPVINLHGKYVVRLFYMGVWRRFIVDDFIPVDENATPLLPRTDNNAELWPMLLSKAIIKLAALTWNDKREITDSFLVSCLTGWIGITLDTRSLSPDQKWDLICKYTCKNPERPEDNANPGNPLVEIFATLTNFDLLENSPSCKYPVYIPESRGTLTDSNRIPPPEVRWKLYRWFEWASRHGISGEHYLGSEARRLKVISVFKGPEIEDVEWVDFKKLEPCLKEILLFYKPSDFEYYARVSDVLQTSAETPLTTSRSKEVKQTNLTPFIRTIKWQHKITAAKNTPLYLLTDSTQPKFFLIEFSTLPKGGLDTSNTDYVIVQKHNFFERSSDADPVALIKTCTAQGTTLFEAEEGRFLFRIFIRAENSYFLRIASNTIFQLGDKFRVQDFMCSESERFDGIIRCVSNAMSRVIQAFGKSEYNEKLREFYRSYLPEGTEIPKRIHSVFLEELASVTKQSFSIPEAAKICHSLRVLFMNPNIGMGEIKSDIFEEENVDHPGSILEKSAIKIQAFFRMTLVRNYKRQHAPSNPRHSEVVQSLRKFLELFNYSKRESVAKILVRRILHKEFGTFYPCLEDLDTIVDIDEWKGTTRNVHLGQWIPLVRIQLNVASQNEKVYAVIDLVTNLQRFMVRVVNNSTKREVTRLVKSVATPLKFPFVKDGYTLIAYGSVDIPKVKEANWHLRICTVKGMPKFHLVEPPGALQMLEISDYYLPNFYNILGRWIIRIKPSNIYALVTFRLSTSYKGVRIGLKVVDGDENVLCEANGGSVIILPCLRLGEGMAIKNKEEGERESRSKSVAPDPEEGKDEAEFYIRAYIAKDSWPFTSTEWNVWTEARIRGTVYDTRSDTRASNSSGKSKRLSKNKGTGRMSQEIYDGNVNHTGLQSPSWRMQVLMDNSDGKIQVEQDKRREIEISGIKRSWEDAEPGRLFRGRSLRDEFLEANLTFSESGESTFSEVNSHGSLVFPELYPRSSERRSLKPSGFQSLPRLPELNMTAYISKEDEEEERWVKTEDDEEMLRNQRAINILDFEQSHASHIEDEAELLDEQRRRNSNLFDTFNEKMELWKISNDAAYQRRKIYLDSIKGEKSEREKSNKKEKRTKRKK